MVLDFLATMDHPYLLQLHLPLWEHVLAGITILSVVHQHTPEKQIVELVMETAGVMHSVTGLRTAVMMSTVLQVAVYG